MAVVRKRTELKSPGILATLPDTMIMAMASPIARPTPSTMEVAMPLLAAGMLTRKIVSIFVAPKAREASSYSLGTAFRAVVETLTIEGRIIMASTIMAASRVAPEGRLKTFWIRGTSTVIPTRPYTTEGMPASSSTAVWITAATLGGAILARNTAVIRPTGTPIITAPAVP